MPSLRAQSRQATASSKCANGLPDAALRSFRVATVGHVAVAVVGARVFEREGAGMARAVIVLTSLSMAPDLDVIGMRLGVPYGATWGHRGATHSLTVAFATAFVTAIAATGLARRRHLFWRFAPIAVAVTVWHGLLDAMTDGVGASRSSGRGRRVASSFRGARFPWRRSARTSCRRGGSASSAGRSSPSLRRGSLHCGRRVVTWRQRGAVPRGGSARLARRAAYSRSRPSSSFFPRTSGSRSAPVRARAGNRGGRALLSRVDRHRPMAAPLIAGFAATFALNSLLRNPMHVDSRKASPGALDGLVLGLHAFGFLCRRVVHVGAAAGYVLGAMSRDRASGPSPR
jgi:hypothetical protein